MLHLPTPMQMTSGGSRTEADFQAHIAARAVDGVKGWTDVIGYTAGTKVYRTTASAAVSANLYGSPWMAEMIAFLSPPNRMLVHALPSAAAFNAQAAAGSEICFTLVGLASPSVSALTRNGLTSLAEVTGYDVVRCPEVLFWEAGAAWKMNPYAGTGPTPYIWP